ncbi:Endonuclease/exonuclease/phosphatase [Paraphysoderma sedebokerense]|nr:Endonuclease/exonuclease/phosphatase [Paraphysoderma sedebokerense]
MPFSNTISVLAATFNVNLKRPNSPPNLSNWLSFDSSSTLPSIIAVGFQEFTKSFYPIDAATITYWSEAVEQALLTTSHDTVNYKLLQVSSLGGLLLFVYADDTLGIESIQDAKVGVGHGFLPIKGAVGCSLKIRLNQSSPSVSICIVNAHLTHGQSVKKRNQDYFEIAHRLIFQSPSALQSSIDDASSANPLFSNPSLVTTNRTIFDHDYLIFLGDLNYRFDVQPNGTLNTLYRAISESNFTYLSSIDQFQAEQSKSYVFKYFYNPVISFPPTYKCIIKKPERQQTHRRRQSNRYQRLEESDADIDIDNESESSIDNVYSKSRIPGWCDRVVFYSPHHLTSFAHSNSHKTTTSLPTSPISESSPFSSFNTTSIPYSALISIQRYSSHPSYTFSDHKPVSCLFSLAVPSFTVSDSPSTFESVNHPDNQVDPKWKEKLQWTENAAVILGHTMYLKGLISKKVVWIPLLTLLIIVLGFEIWNLRDKQGMKNDWVEFGDINPGRVEELI